MKTKIITLFILCSSAYFASAQFVKNDWGQYFGKTSTSLLSSTVEIEDMEVDVQGNIYVVGGFTDTVDFDPGPGVAQFVGSSTGGNAWFAKYSVTGALIWVKVFTGVIQSKANQLAIDASGNIYIAGRSNGSIDIDPSAGVLNTPVNSVWFMAKYDTNGNILWGQGGTSSSALFITDLFFNSSGQLIRLAASTSSSTPFVINFIDITTGNSVSPSVLYSNSNAFNIDNLSGTSNFRCTQDFSGNYLVTGMFSGRLDAAVEANNNPNTSNVTFDLNSSQPGSGVSLDMFIAKYNSQWELIWAFNLGASTSPLFQNIANIVTDITGNVYVAGTIGSDIDFDPSSATSIVNASSNSPANKERGFIAKYSPSGNLLWARGIDEEYTNIQATIRSYVKDFGINNSGQLYLLCQLRDLPKDIDRSSNKFIIPRNTNSNSIINSKAFLLSIDNNGNTLNVNTLNSNVLFPGGTLSTSLHIDNSSNVYLGIGKIARDYSSVNRKISFGACNNNASTLLPSQRSDGATIAKYSPCNSTLSITTQPRDTVGCAGLPLAVNMAVSGSSCYTYHWFKRSCAFGCVNNNWEWVSDSSVLYFPALNTNDTTIYICTIEGECGSVTTREVQIGIKDPIEFQPNLGSTPTPVNVCTGSSYTFNVNTFVISVSGGGPLTYQWKKGNVVLSNSITHTINNIALADDGLYYGIVSNSCSSDTVFVQLNVRETPVATISPATVSICNGESATLTAGGGTNYNWSNGLGSNATIDVFPTSNTTYSVTVFNASGTCSATASRQVTVNAIPTASINPSTVSICEGTSTSLTASGGASYTWSNSLGSGATKSISPTVTTIYTVTVTSAANCTAVASSEVTVNNNPTASINGPTTICSGLDATLTASGGNSYVWSNGETTTAITVSPTSTTTYTVTVTGTGNCTATASQTISVQSAPTATISGNTTICNGESTTLTANGGNSYVWSNNQTTAAITVSPTATTTYTVTVSIGANCTASESITITVNQPSALTQLTETICQGSSYTFDGNTLTQANTYTATFTNAAGCDSTVELTLNVTPANVTRLDTTVCDGATINFFSQTITQAGLYTETLQTTAGCDSIVELNVAYLNPITTTVNAQICNGQTYEFDGQQLNQSNTYTATFTSAQGCDSTVTLNLSVVSEITETVNASICDGDSYAFDGQQLSIADTYTATFQSAGGCDSVVTLNLTVNPLPQPTVTANNADLSTETFATYQWQLNGNDIQGANQQTYTATQNGDYSVQVTDANGCENTSNAVNVTVVSVANYDLGFTVYPNPTIGIINIETAINNAEISIITLEGKVVFSKKATTNNTAIDMSSLAHGMYIIEVKAENSISRVRVVKE